MSKFERRYSEDQISACVHAHLDRKIRPKRRILELAEAGQLTARDGRTLKPFTMNPLSFNGFITAERKRRRGPKFGPGLDALDRPDDVMEGMRRRMIAVANDELTFAESSGEEARPRASTADRAPHARSSRTARTEGRPLPAARRARQGRPHGRRRKRRHRGQDARRASAGQTAPEPPSKQETQAETRDVSAHARINGTTEQAEGTSPGPAIANLQGIERQHEASDRAAAAMVRSIPTRHV